MRKSKVEEVTDTVDRIIENKRSERKRIPRMDQNILDFVNRCQELRKTVGDLACIDPLLDFELDALTAREKVVDDLLGALSDLNWDSVEYWHPKLQGGRGKIIGKQSGAPFYNVQKLGLVDINPRAGSALINVGLGVTGWNDCRNLAEPLSSPGYLQIGDLVDVKIFFDGLSSGEDPFEIGTPFIEVAPQVFAPPAPG